MLPKIVVVLMMLAIVASLGSALVFLFRGKGPDANRRMAQALTWRIGISLALFALLMAGFYFGFITPHGLAPR